MVSENLTALKKEIDKLNPLQKVEIVPATKTVSPDVINSLSGLNIKVVGENRVQELLEKVDKVRGIEWHFIGALQTNKVKQIIDKVTLIHSLDRISLAEEIDKQAKKRGIVVDVLIEINIGGEENKSGIDQSCVEAFVKQVSGYSGLRLKGFMSVLPKDADESLYKKMQEIFLYQKNKNQDITILSMGMSNDYKTAIKYGSTLIRPGRVLFGEREK